MQHYSARCALYWFVLPIFLLFSIPIQGWAQGEKIPWSVLGTGGTIGASDGVIVLSATLGQPVVGMRTGETSISQGFWLPLPFSIGSVDPRLETVVSGAFKLRNYPNPFATSTTISYSLDSRSHVTLAVYDLLGNSIALLSDQVEEEGDHAHEWDGMQASGGRAAGGVYLYILTVQSPNAMNGTDVRSERRKLVLVR